MARRLVCVMVVIAKAVSTGAGGVFYRCNLDRVFVELCVSSFLF